jgi:NSS family neurotransmitter:Na+ symporter
LSDSAAPREQWGSKIGLILAMAGNAVGLGNFLRFPKQAVENGGGTFMIPYFIALILVGIPLMWIEWGVGRYGGQHGQGSTPGMFNALWKHPVAKYLGVLGLFMPFVVLVYYCYLESQTLAWTAFSAIGAMRGLDQEAMRQFLASYQDLTDPSIHAVWVPFLFYFITISVNFWVVSKGLSGGIEKLAKIGMPILFVFAALLVIRVLTLDAQPVVDAACATGTACGPMDGLNFMYSPDWGALASPKVWLAATGQIFFTLSVGMGSLQAYASYLSKKDDIALSGIATASTNEMAEVVLGGSLAIPAVVTFFGVAGAVSIAKGGSFDLGFIAMPLVFNKLPGGAIVPAIAGIMWFGLLFFAGITSSVSMITPVKAFLEENLGWTKQTTLRVLLFVSMGLGLLHVLYNARGFLDEWDYWAGTFGLVILALVETIIFVWIFGPNNAWNELHEGASIRIPKFFKFVLTYITPVFLLVMMIWWGYVDAFPKVMMEGVPEREVAVRTASRWVMLGILAVQLVLIRTAWARKGRKEAA